MSRFLSRRAKLRGDDARDLRRRFLRRMLAKQTKFWRCCVKEIVLPNLRKNPAKVAKDYLKRGWQPIPLPEKSKNPNRPGWQNFIIGESEIPTYFPPSANVGVLLGNKSNNLVDVDLDSPDAEKIADLFLPPTEAIFGRRSAPRAHRLYVCETEIYEKFQDPLLMQSADPSIRKTACIVELRGKSGLQTVFPDSVHPTGEGIRWSDNGEPAKVEAAALRRSVALLASACLVSKFWKEGVRHDLNLALIGAMVNSGADKDEIKKVIRAVCHLTGDEETFSRLTDVETTFQRAAAGRTFTGFPTLENYIDKSIVAKLGDWLNLVFIGSGKATAPGGQKTHSDVSKKHQIQNQQAQNLRPLKTVKLSDVEALPVRWLWKPFLALGTFSLLDGEEGIGKTFLTCAIANAIASGKGLPLIPDDDHVEPSNVVLISAEDSLPYVIKPRLESMNAPCERIFAVDEQFTLNSEGIGRLALVLAEYAPKLVVIDPLFSYAGKINLNNDNEIRTVTDELKRLAENFDCAILGIRHIGKSKGLGDARNAGLNGVGWRASARSHLLIGKNPDNEDQRALCQTKTNLGIKYSKSLGFEIKGGEFFWTGESQLTAETMLAQKRFESLEDKSDREAAKEFLKDLLKDGVVEASKVTSEARQNGFSQPTINRAKKDLNIHSFKTGFDKTEWFWHLPDDKQLSCKKCNENPPVTIGSEDYQKPAEGCQINKLDNLRVNTEKKAIYNNDLAEDYQDNQSDNLRGESDNLRKDCFGCSVEMKFIEKENIFFCEFCGAKVPAG